MRAIYSTLIHLILTTLTLYGHHHNLGGSSILLANNTNDKDPNYVFSIPPINSSYLMSKYSPQQAVLKHPQSMEFDILGSHAT